MSAVFMQVPPSHKPEHVNGKTAEAYVLLMMDGYMITNQASELDNDVSTPHIVAVFPTAQEAADALAATLYPIYWNIRP